MEIMIIDVKHESIYLIFKQKTVWNLVETKIVNRKSSFTQCILVLTKRKKYHSFRYTKHFRNTIADVQANTAIQLFSIILLLCVNKHYMYYIHSILLLHFYSARIVGYTKIVQSQNTTQRNEMKWEERHRKLLFTGIWVYIPRILPQLKFAYSLWW